MELCKESATIKLEPVKAYWGTQQCRKIETVADVAGSLTDTYFDVNVINPVDFSEIQGYVYFDTDPSIAGKTGYVAARSEADSAEVIAQNIADALASVNVNVLVTGNVVEVQNKYLGAITAEVDSGSTGFTFNVNKSGIGGELGRTAQGGSTLSVEVQTAELKTDQTGEYLAGESYIGSSATIEMPLIEINKSRLEVVIGQVTGDVHTPSGGTSLVGYGEAKLYQLLNNLAGQLILHPIRLDDSDKSEDYIFHKSAPLPQDINFSGGDIQTLNVTFKAYLDRSVNKKINLFAIGDWTQDLA